MRTCREHVAIAPSSPDKVVAIPVEMQRQVLMIQKVLKTVQVPQDSSSTRLQSVLQSTSVQRWPDGSIGEECWDTLITRHSQALHKST